MGYFLCKKITITVFIITSCVVNSNDLNFQCSDSAWQSVIPSHCYEFFLQHIQVLPDICPHHGIMTPGLDHSFCLALASHYH